MLSAIEYTWSMLKAGVKKDLGNEISKVLDGEGRWDITQTEFRLEHLESIIQKNINEININHNYSRKYLIIKEPFHAFFLSCI